MLYKKLKCTWIIKHEILSLLLFFTFSGTSIYFYNHFIINQLEYNFHSHLKYYKDIVLFMLPIVAPVLIFLRQQFGKRTAKKLKDSILIKGSNKHEELNLKRTHVLFIHALENYVEIYFIDDNNKINSKTFRQTLTNIKNQQPFLERCHRSYLVNISAIKNVTGNSQNSKIHFYKLEQNIPLSKTYYKDIKIKISKR